jgi:hypothetical protein
MSEEEWEGRGGAYDGGRSGKVGEIGRADRERSAQPLGALSHFSLLFTHF